MSNNLSLSKSPMVIPNQSKIHDTTTCKVGKTSFSVINREITGVMYAKNPITTADFDKKAFDELMKKMENNDAALNELLDPTVSPDNVDSIDITRICAFLCDTNDGITPPYIFELIHSQIDTFLNNKNDSDLTKVETELLKIKTLVVGLQKKLNGISIKKHESWYNKDSENFNKFFTEVLLLAESHINNLDSAFKHTFENKNLPTLLNKICETIDSTNKQMRGFSKIDFNKTVTNDFITPSLVDVAINNEPSITKLVNNQLSGDIYAEVGADISLQMLPSLAYATLSLGNRNMSLLTQHTIGLQKKYILLLLKLYAKHNTKENIEETHKIYVPNEYKPILEKFLNIKRGNVFDRLFIYNTASIDKFNHTIKSDQLFESKNNLDEFNQIDRTRCVDDFSGYVYTKNKFKQLIKSNNYEGINNLLEILNLMDMPKYLDISTFVFKIKDTKHATLRGDLLSHLMLRFATDPENNILKTTIKNLINLKKKSASVAKYLSYNYTNFLNEINEINKTNELGIHAKDRISFMSYFQDLLLGIKLNENINVEFKEELMNMILQNNIEKLKTLGPLKDIRQKRSVFSNELFHSAVFGQGYNIPIINNVVGSASSSILKGAVKASTKGLGRGLVAPIVPLNKLCKYGNTLTFNSVKQVLKNTNFYFSNVEPIQMKSIGGTNSVRYSNRSSDSDTQKTFPDVNIPFQKSPRCTTTVTSLTKDIRGCCIFDNNTKNRINQFDKIKKILELKDRHNDYATILYHALIFRDVSNNKKCGSKKDDYLFNYLLNKFDTLEGSKVILLKLFGEILLKHDEKYAKINDSDALLANFFKEMPNDNATDGSLHIYKYLAISYTNEKYESSRVDIIKAVRRTKTDNTSAINIINKHSLADETTLSIILRTVGNVVSHACSVIASLLWSPVVTAFIKGGFKWLRTIISSYSKATTYSRISQTWQSKSIYRLINSIDGDNKDKTKMTGRFTIISNLSKQFELEYKNNDYKLDEQIESSLKNSNIFSVEEIAYHTRIISEFNHLNSTDLNIKPKENIDSNISNSSSDTACTINDIEKSNKLISSTLFNSSNSNLSNSSSDTAFTTNYTNQVFEKKPNNQITNTEITTEIITTNPTNKIYKDTITKEQQILNIINTCKNWLFYKINNEDTQNELLNPEKTSQNNSYNQEKPFLIDKYLQTKAFFELVSIVKLSDIDKMLKLRILINIAILFMNDKLGLDNIRLENDFTRKQGYFVLPAVTSMISAITNGVAGYPDFGFDAFKQNLCDSGSELTGSALVNFFNLSDMSKGNTISYQNCMTYLKTTLVDILNNNDTINDLKITLKTNGDLKKKNTLDVIINALCIIHFHTGRSGTRLGKTRTSKLLDPLYI